MLVVFKPSSGDGLGQLSDGVQEILGADVVANRAVGDRSVEQRGKGGAESLQEVAGQPGEGRVPRVQRRGESAFGREQFGETVDPLGECFGRLVRGTQGRARVGDGVDSAFHDGFDQVRTLREVPVQRAYSGIAFRLAQRTASPDADHVGREPVQYRTLGRTGIQVSPYALGTLMFATVMGNAPEDSARIIGRALDAGINLIDTADAYGDSEDVVGKALEGRRDEVVLATKFGRPIGQDPNHQGASGRWIATAVENSLRRLRTDYIDLYQLHRPDPRTDIEETLSALTDLIRSGKVRAIGASQTPASDIVQAQWVAERRGLARFHTEQPAYSILNRGIEREILPATQCFGMGTLVWGPLGQGLLTGRVRKNQHNDLRRAGMVHHLTDEHRLDVVEQLVPLAEEAGLPMTHLAMAFTIAHQGVTSALLGARTMDHLDGLLAGLDVALTDDVLDRIDEIVPPGTDIGALDQAYQPPAVENPGLRRRPQTARAAA